MNGLIQDELEGQPVYGATSWNEFWLMGFRRSIKYDLPDRQKADDYIINRRRELGLPEIEGYPFEDDTEKRMKDDTNAGGKE